MTPTSVHSTQHARDEAIYTPTLLHKGDESRDTTLIVGGMAEMSKDHLLEGVDLVLQAHKIGDGLVATKP